MSRDFTPNVACRCRYLQANRRAIRIQMAVEGIDSQRDLAERTRVNNAMLSQILNGRRLVDAATADRIAETLRLPVKDLFIAARHPEAVAS